MSNKKARNDQKEKSTNGFLVQQKNVVLSKKIGDHKLYTIKDLILATKDHLVTMAQE